MEGMLLWVLLFLTLGQKVSMSQLRKSYPSYVIKNKNKVELNSSTDIINWLTPFLKNIPISHKIKLMD